MMNKLLDILVCPVCKSRLKYDKQKDEFVCKADRIAFVMRDGIPVMIDDEARVLEAEEEV